MISKSFYTILTLCVILISTTHAQTNKHANAEERAQSTLSEYQELLKLEPTQSGRIYQLMLDRNHQADTVRSQYADVMAAMKKELKGVPKHSMRVRRQALLEVKEKYRAPLQPMKDSLKAINDRYDLLIKAQLTEEQLEEIDAKNDYNSQPVLRPKMGSSSE